MDSDGRPQMSSKGHTHNTVSHGPDQRLPPLCCVPRRAAGDPEEFVRWLLLRPIAENPKIGKERGWML